MKNKITSNIGLKIGSLLFAIILWLLVNNINDPVIPKRFSNVPVTLVNTEMITNTGQVYDVLDESDVLNTVTVTARRSIINSLSSENIIATADMNDLSSLDTISIKLSTDVYNNQLETIKGSSDVVKLSIEERKTKTLALQATTSGTAESGYIVGEVTTEQNLVRISGPESLIDKITKAIADVPVSGFTSDIGTDADIKLYDAEDNLVEADNVTQNIEAVRVNVSILQTKTVPINLNSTGTAAAGYMKTGVIDSTPATVLIAGKSSVLANVTAIDVPDTELDITGINENLVKEIDIRPYLPSGVSLADKEFTGSVTATVYIEQQTSKRVDVSEDRISITNMPEGFSSTMTGTEEGVTISIIGLPEEINAVHGADVKGIVDMARVIQEYNLEVLEPGYYTTEVEFNLSENITILEPVTVTLHVIATEEQE